MAENIKQQAEVAIDKAAYSPWMERLARFGYAMKGVVYIIVGALATQLAFGWGGSATDTHGALREIEKQPLGKIGLAAVAFGLVGYVIWRWIQALADTDHEGKQLKGIAVRVAYFTSGLVYGGLAIAAAKALIDVAEPESSSTITESWIASVLMMPFGRFVVIGGSAFVAGFGLYQIYKGVTAKFKKRLKLGEMNAQNEHWAIWSGRIGYSARGVVFCIIGFFGVRAGVNFSPNEAKGADEALQTLAWSTYGEWTLGTVALGLIAYGFFSLVEARYRTIAGS